MPNLRTFSIGRHAIPRIVVESPTYYRVEYDADPGIYVQGSDGHEFVCTKADIQAIYKAMSGNAAARKAATIATIQERLIAALGDEWVDFLLDIDFDPLTTDFTKSNTKPRGAT